MASAVVVESEATSAGMLRLEEAMNTAAEATVTRDFARTVRSTLASNAPSVSGTLAGSNVIRVKSKTGHIYSVQIGPTTPYARRIELGLHRADSMGRIYHQHGVGYVKRTEAELLPEKYQEALANAWLTVLGGGISG